MLCFAIALRSKRTTRNWKQVVKDFNSTLNSIFNQKNSNFRVLVACHEIPPLEREYDDRLKFITVDFPVPNEWVQYCRDRAMKLMACTMEIKKHYSDYSEEDGGAFVFPVDADDLISNRVSEFVNTHLNANGFRSKKGLVWNRSKNRKIVIKSPYFGGSCNVMKLYYDELPDALPEESKFFLKETGEYLIKNYKICWDDHEVAEKFRQLGRPFTMFPFASTIYVLGAGENISDIDPREQKLDGSFSKLTGINFHPGILVKRINPLNKKILSPKLKREFSIYRGYK
ncbi:hypothetical protein [Butyricicoccus porcorum]|uniref:hypothetical protein n=1 Tax=Butyricicoccus porcorum TaxID=1945634 RepID=UPI003F4A91B9